MDKDIMISIAAIVISLMAIALNIWGMILSDRVTSIPMEKRPEEPGHEYMPIYPVPDTTVYYPDTLIHAWQ